MTPPDTVIDVQGLRKSYRGVDAVAGIDFQVARGEIFGILGPNGAGKTTTVECLQGLRGADSGAIRVLGLDPRTQSRALRQRIGSQLQESALPEHIKVWEALDYFASAAGPAADWSRLLDDWGLGTKRNATFGSLSGGQRQRLFIALALINRPELVFLDEMTTGLDPAARRTAWDLIRRVRDGGATVVLVTHFMEEAEELCDRVAIINNGQVAAMGTISELLTRHAAVLTLRFTCASDRVDWLHAVPHVHSFARRGREVSVTGDGPVLVHVAGALLERGLEPDDMRVERATLEDVFLKLVGQAPETVDERTAEDNVA